LKARTELAEDMVEEILSSTAKKTGIKQRKESRDRIGAWPNVQFFEDMASTMQPKERIPSLGYQLFSTKACTSLSYRKATEMLYLFFYRNEQNSIKLCTLSDMIERARERVSERLAKLQKKA